MNKSIVLLVAILLSCQVAVAKEKKQLSFDARALSISCDYYVNGPAALHSDLFGSGNVEIASACVVRLLVSLEGAPLVGLPGLSFEVNHFESSACNSDHIGSVNFSDQGNGVYEADLPCEPDDMSVVVSDMSQSGIQNSIVTWVRSHDPYARTAIASHHYEVHSNLLAIESLLQAHSNHVSGVLSAIHSTVFWIEDIVEDIADSLP